MALIDVVKYEADAEQFAWKFPITNLKIGTQLVVKTAQRAFFVRDGEVLDEFEPGRYTLKSNNLPLLDKLVNLPFGGDSPFQAEVWFVNELSKLDNKWGTSKPIQLEDPKYGIIVPVRAFGQFGIRVDDPRSFLESLVGTLKSFSAKKIVKYFRGHLVSAATSIIVDTISSQEVSILEIGRHLDELSAVCKERLYPEFSTYGIDLSGFQVMSINFPEDDASVQRLKEVKDKAALLNTVGEDVYRFDKQIDVLRDAAQNEGNAGDMMGAGMGFGMGMGAGSAMGQQMHQMGKSMDAGSSPDAEQKKSSAPPPPPNTKQYYVYVEDERYGPYRKSTLINMITDDTVGVSEETYVWREGMDDWREAKEVKEIASAFRDSKTPPPPPKTPRG